VDELQEILERKIRELASGVLSEPQSLSLDCSAEADVRMGPCGQERMFACLFCPVDGAVCG
jgi:hypothetical protein